MSCERELRNGTRRFAKSFRSQTPVPAVLHVCRESRFEGLAIYSSFLKTNTSPIYTYVSFEQDTIRCVDSVLEYIGDAEVQRVQRMILDVKDLAYFGFFHMDVVRQMWKLKQLDLLIQQEERSRRGWRYEESLTTDFEEAKHKDLGWECPHIRILDKITSEEIRVVTGGALLPGWKEG